MRSHQVGLFEDDKGVIRCQGRLGNSETEAAMILNCQPISYASSKDQEEPLTPSHLIAGRRLNAPPEIDSPADADFLISPGDLSRRARHLDMIRTPFWKRWSA